MKLVILFLAVMASHLFAAEYNSDSLNDLTAELRAVIPEGWKVSINQFHDDNSDDDSIHIKVHRAKTVQFLKSRAINGPPPSGPPPRPGEKQPESPEPSIPQDFFDFDFYLIDYLSPRDYARLAKENAVIEARLVEYTKAMSNVKRHGKPRALGDTDPLYYHPETEDEKKRLQEFVDYKKFNPKHHIRQKCYYEEMSFYFFDPRSIQRLKSKKIDAECTKILNLIMKVFKSYKA